MKIAITSFGYQLGANETETDCLTSMFGNVLIVVYISVYVDLV